MKKLYLKNGSYNDVEVISTDTPTVKSEILKIFDYEDNHFCTIQRINGKITIGFTAKVLQYYEFMNITEIAENFTQYFNNLNQ